MARNFTRSISGVRSSSASSSTRSLKSSHDSSRLAYSALESRSVGVVESVTLTCKSSLLYACAIRDLDVATCRCRGRLARTPSARCPTKGRGQAEAAGRALAAMGVELDACVTSPKVRARDTAALACKALGIEPEEDAAPRGRPVRPARGGRGSRRGGAAGGPRPRLLAGREPADGRAGAHEEGRRWPPSTAASSWSCSVRGSWHFWLRRADRGQQRAAEVARLQPDPLALEAGEQHLAAGGQVGRQRLQPAVAVGAGRRCGASSGLRSRALRPARRRSSSTSSARSRSAWACTRGSISSQSWMSPSSCCSALAVRTPSVAPLPSAGRAISST